MRKQLEALIAAADDANAAVGNYPVPRTNPALANTVKERIIAGYVSNTWKWDRFSIVAGVRVENTKVTSVGAAAVGNALDRKSVVEGKSLSVRVDLGGRRHIKKKKKCHTQPVTLRHNKNTQPKR